MHPVFFSFGEVRLYSYGVMVQVALALGLTVALLAGRRLRASTGAVATGCCLALGGLLVGAKAGYWLAHLDGLRTFSEILGGGLLLPAGAALSLLLVVGGLRSLKPRGGAFDAIAIGVLFGLGVGRVGCFLAGCCYGIPSEAPWALHFPTGSLTPPQLEGVAVHPTQLYLSALWLGQSALLFWVAPRLPPGMSASLAVIGLAVSSLAILPLRFELSPHATHQVSIWCLLVLVGSALAVVAVRRRGERAGLSDRA